MSGHNSEREGILDVSTDTRPEAEKLASTIVSYPRDDARARYLGLRCSGFTIREALKLIGYVHSALSRWRLDPEFLEMEKRIPEYRKELSLEYANLEFMRNYRLVLEKDFRVLKASLYPETIVVNDEGSTVQRRIPVPLSKSDQEYLLKMRTQYTPQQLQIIQTLVAADSKESDFDFTKFVLEARKVSAGLEQRVRIEAQGKMSKNIDMPEIIEEEADTR